MPGKKMKSIQGGAKGRRMYEKIKAKLGKTAAAKITNAAMPPGKSKKGYGGGGKSKGKR